MSLCDGLTGFFIINNKYLVMYTEVPSCFCSTTSLLLPVFGHWYTARTRSVESGLPSQKVSFRFIIKIISSVGLIYNSNYLVELSFKGNKNMKSEF